MPIKSYLGKTFGGSARSPGIRRAKKLNDFGKKNYDILWFGDNELILYLQGVMDIYNIYQVLVLCYLSYKIISTWPEFLKKTFAIE